MKKSIQIQIPEPCHENWDKMTAVDQGRFCNACSKVVVDFSMMSDKEILNHISKASSSICGRVYNDQLNRPIQMRTERRQYTFKYFWSLLISSFLIGAKANAQGKVRVDSITNTSTEIKGDVEVIAGMVSTSIKDDEIFLSRRVIKGQVTDEAGMPIESATVIIENSKFGKDTDSKGRFKFKIPGNLNDLKITVSSIGYEEVSIDLNDENTAALNIVMKKSNVELLGEVVVIGYEYQTCSMTTGLFAIKTPKKTWSDTLRAIIIKDDIKIYPNPVKQGNAFNISFKVAETGNYKMELYDASGRLVHASTVPISSKKYVMNFGNSTSFIPGMYFVKILNAKGKNVYSGSLLVQ